MRTIIPRDRGTVTAYTLEFERLDIPGDGYSFPCNADGLVRVDDLNVDARENLRICRFKAIPVSDGKVVRRTRIVVTEEVKKCDQCNGYAYLSRGCGVFVCSKCGEHEGLARCYCGWSASGGNGADELREMGEVIDDE